MGGRGGVGGYPHAGGFEKKIVKYIFQEPNFTQFWSNNLQIYYWDNRRTKQKHVNSDETFQGFSGFLKILVKLKNSGQDPNTSFFA